MLLSRRISQLLYLYRRTGIPEANSNNLLNNIQNKQDGRSTPTYGYLRVLSIHVR